MVFDSSSESEDSQELSDHYCTIPEWSEKSSERNQGHSEGVKDEKNTNDQGKEIEELPKPEAEARRILEASEFYRKKLQIKYLVMYIAVRLKSAKIRKSSRSRKSFAFSLKSLYTLRKSILNFRRSSSKSNSMYGRKKS